MLFSEFLHFPLFITIPPLLHTHLSPPHEVCDSPEKAAHCHTQGTKLGGFISDPALGWSQSKGSSYDSRYSSNGASVSSHIGKIESKILKSVNWNYTWWHDIHIEFHEDPKCWGTGTWA
jgi:hypothetical protein